MAEFCRTASGLTNEWRFSKEVLVYVEGPTDMGFYEEILGAVGMHLKPLGGKKASIPLVEGLKKDNIPVVVVLDGDYGILEPMQRTHPRLIRLERYSCENYLAEKGPVVDVCSSVTAGKRDSNQSLALFRQEIGNRFDVCLEHFQNSFVELAILDVARVRYSPARAPVFKSLDQLLRTRDVPEFCPAKLGQKAASARSHLAAGEEAEAKRLVDAYLAYGEFIHFVNGHHALELLVCFLRAEVSRANAGHQTKDNLRTHLIKSVWSGKLGQHHRRLKLRLSRAVHEARKLRSALP